jgi:hypothetical protein
MMFLRILFGFLSPNPNFSRYNDGLACMAPSHGMLGRWVSHISFPDRAEAFLSLWHLLADEQTHWFFSQIFSLDRLGQPEKQFRFSRITFRPTGENAVCATLAHWKQRQQSVRKSYARKPVSIAAKRTQCHGRVS